MPEPLRITIHPERFTPGPVSGTGDDLALSDGAWGATLEDFKPQKAAPSKPENIDGAWGASLPDHSPETETAAKTLHRDVSAPEAFGRSAATGATFGLEPALEGIPAASGKPQPTDIAGRVSGAAAARFPLGLYNLAKENILDPMFGTSDKAAPATQAYRKARDEAQAALEAGREQHPVISFAGELAGGAFTPLPGIGAGTLPARLARGAVAGGVGGAAYGAGSAISQGKDLGDIAKDATFLGAAGAGIGGLFGGALGPRVVGPAVRPGQRAAHTAADLGAPLPRGVASDSRFVQATTSKLRQIPFAGERIGQAVDATQEAAGQRIGQIAAGARGAAPNRALAGSVLRPALQKVIDDNNGRIDLAYHALRHVIDPHKFGPVTHTKAALEGIRRQRRGARSANPDAGLADVINMIEGGKGGTHGGGISFNALTRIRNDIGKTLGLAKNDPNPGFNVGDFKRIYAAMSKDMEAIVSHPPIARVPPAQAVGVLRQAHTVAKILIDRNKAVQRVLNVKTDESLAGSLITAAQEKTGNLRMLAELRAEMHPDDFHHIAGTMLAELGHNNASGEFSLNQFVTNWDKVSDHTKSILFSPQHLANINEIAGMGRHIKGALRESSSSHSASLLVLLDVAKDVALLSTDVASGGLGAGSAIGAGTTAGLWVLARWLGNPAKASSMGAWTRAYRAVLGNQTPVRMAAFQVATRNLSNNLGISLEDIAKHIGGPNQGAAPPASPALPDKSTRQMAPAKSQDRVPALAR
jgi:hypothetical protein